MENELTDKEKIDAWIELIEFNNFLTDESGRPLPGEFGLATEAFLKKDGIEFNEHGSAICNYLQRNNKVIIPDKAAAKEFLDTAQKKFLLFIYTDLIVNTVTAKNVEDLYIVWVKLMNRISDEFDYDIPRKLLPNFIKKDTF